MASFSSQFLSVFFQSLSSGVYEGSTLGMEAALHARDRVGVQDFVLLEDYTNINAFIDNLRKRFSENLIYVSNLIVFCRILPVD